MEPYFLGLGEILAIHLDQVERYGGSPGIRDIGLLQSAVAMPAAGVRGQFLHSDLFEMAAAYLFHVVANHPFVDGNKRTGVVVALVFLAMNGVACEPDEERLEAMVRRVATGGASKAEVAEFLRAEAGTG